MCSRSAEIFQFSIILSVSLNLLVKLDANASRSFLFFSLINSKFRVNFLHFSLNFNAQSGILSFQIDQKTMLLFTRIHMHIIQCTYFLLNVINCATKLCHFAFLPLYFIWQFVFVDFKRFVMFYVAFEGVKSF